jgi:hypothetical protein
MPMYWRPDTPPLYPSKESTEAEDEDTELLGFQENLGSRISVAMGMVVATEQGGRDSEAATHMMSLAAMAPVSLLGEQNQDQN